MKFRDAVEKSIRAFYDGELPEKAIEASDKPFIYTMEYFAAEEDDNNGKK